MKVVHVCTVVGSGGAAHSMLNLHEGLLQLGIDSTILAESCLSKNEQFIESPHRPETKVSLDRLEWDLVWNNRTDVSNTHFSLDLFGQLITDHPLIQNADVVNLHWTSEFLSSVSVADLALIKKPVIWTLHDIHPLTGGCHFAAGCRRFYEACGNCPQLLTDYWDMTTSTHSAMKRAVSLLRPHYVAPSAWMRDNIVHSGVTSNSPVSLIPYGIDLSIFKPGLKDSAREKLGLSNEIQYILLACHSLKEKRKGAAYALEILQHIKTSSECHGTVASGNLRLLCCGHDTEDLVVDGWTIDKLGYLAHSEMALLYRSADVLLFTSMEDNLPNVIIEAMACGLPVVGHSVGGAVDLLGGEEAAGRLFTMGDARQGAECVMELFREKNLSEGMIARGIKRATDRYSIEQQARKYAELYQDLLVENSRRLPAPSTIVTEGAREQVAISFSLNLKNLENSNRYLTEIKKHLADTAKDFENSKDQNLRLRSNWWVKLGKKLGLVSLKR